jgi:NADH dehydrogenase/NADH:ubiquinone oxidoreductase subunit G
VIQDDGTIIAAMAGSKRPKVLYLVGDIPFIERPDCDFLIVQDTYLPPFKVDAFLPAASFGEAGGTLVNVEGRHAVVVGRSNIVGKPVANLLLQKKEGANATVTVCHTGTKDVSEFTKQADILIVAAGKAEAITGDMIKEGITSHRKNRK